MRPSGNQYLVEALAIEIKARRLELAYSQEELAGRAELDRPYISLMEMGKKQPTISVLYLIAGALDLSFGEFAERIERRYKTVLRAKRRAAKQQG